jgi:hypothetical protein
VAYVVDLLEHLLGIIGRQLARWRRALRRLDRRHGGSRNSWLLWLVANAIRREGTSDLDDEVSTRWPTGAYKLRGVIDRRKSWGRSMRHSRAFSRIAGARGSLGVDEADGGRPGCGDGRGRARREAATRCPKYQAGDVGARTGAKVVIVVARRVVEGAFRAEKRWRGGAQAFPAMGRRLRDADGSFLSVESTALASLRAARRKTCLVTSQPITASCQVVKRPLHPPQKLRWGHRQVGAFELRRCHRHRSLGVVRHASMTPQVVASCRLTTP